MDVPVNLYVVAICHEVEAYERDSESMVPRIMVPITRVLEEINTAGSSS